MRRAGQLFFCCLLLLANLSRSAIPAESKDEPIESLTNLAVRRQKLTEAIAEREQAQLAGDQVTVIKLSNRIVELYLKLYEFDSALTQSQTSLATARAIAGSGDTKLLVDTFIISGRVYITRTQSTNALPLLKKALDLSANQAYRQGEAQSYAQLAGAYFDLGQLEEAQASNDQALRISQELQDKRIEAFATMTQGYLLMRNDRPAEALVAFKNAENIWRSLNDRAELANALVDQNLLAICQGQWQEALKSLNEAQELLVDKEAEPYLAGKIANSFGEIYEVYGRLDTALSYFQEALNYFRDGAHDIQGTVTA